MKISKVEVYVLTIPFREVTKVAYTTYFDTTNAFIKIYTDDGQTGIGEASPSPAFTGESIGSIMDALKIMSAKIVGNDPFDIGKIHNIINKHFLYNRAAKCAIDVALYDIMGRSSNLPICKLLGGAYRSEFPTQHIIPIQEPEKMGKMAIDLLSEGYSIFEVKVGLEPKKDVERVKSIEDAVGENALLVVDANCAWQPIDAVKCLKQMEGYSNILAEQPTKSLEGLSWIRKKVDMPIIADESIFTSEDALRIINYDAADIISMKVLKAGGFYECLKIRSICDAAGVPYRIDDMAVTKIGNTASAHLAASSKNIVACGVAQHSLLSKDVNILKSGGVEISNGLAILPKGSGLGLELNEEILGDPLFVFP